MLSLLLAAGLIAPHHPPTVEGRVSLLEARQMLDSQQIWTLRSQLPPEALKAIGDLQLHVQHDQEQEDKVRELSETVQRLQQRLAALELALADRMPVESSTRIPVAPMQLKALEVPAPKKAKAVRKPKRQ